MAFDAMAEQEQFRAVNTLADLGVERILTHGGPLSTPIVDNIPHLQKLIAHTRGRIAILPGGGISWKNAKDIAKLLGVCEVHGSKVVCI
jgi:copper homeostasis protein